MDKTIKFNILRTSLAIIIALAISFIIIFIVSEEPVEAISKLILGPLKSKRTIGNVIELMIPLIFTGVGLSIMFSANQVNLAAEGAFHMGGLVGGVVALTLPLPPVIHPIAAIFFGGMAGAMVTAIPAILKIKTSAFELVSSLMMNYLVLYFATYILNYYLRDVDAGAIVSHLIPKSAKLLKILSGTHVHAGLIIALLTAGLAYVFLYKTKAGYALRLTGENEQFAKYSGVNIVKVILISQLLGGCISGIGGSVQLLGIYRRFSWVTLLGYGWSAVIVAALAKNNPKYVPVSALFLAYIRIGADIMARNTDVTLEMVSITQGVIIILIVAEQFLSKYKHRAVAREAKLSINMKGFK